MRNITFLVILGLSLTYSATAQMQAAGYTYQQIAGWDVYVIDDLLRVLVFVDWAVTSGAAVYHPSTQWLLSNGYPVENAQAIEISNVHNFINWTRQHQPLVVLHEMTHTYHDRVLGFGDPTIQSACDDAMTAGLDAPRPNPTDGVVNVDGAVEVFDTTGRRERRGADRLDLGGLSGGVCFVRGAGKSWPIVVR